MKLNTMLKKYWWLIAIAGAGFGIWWFFFRKPKEK